MQFNYLLSEPLLLVYVVSRAGYYIRVEHLCRELWSRSGCGRGQSCKECDESGSLKTESRSWAEAKAWTMWLNAPEMRLDSAARP